MHWVKPLAELCRDLPVSLSGPDVMINDITEDTRDVSEGCLFVARRGRKFDGRELVPQAIAAGAIAVLAESGVEIPRFPVVTCDCPDQISVSLADRLHGQPDLPVIAVTGTNGKTTTASFLRHLLGSRTGLIGSIEVHDGKAAHSARLTTPRPIELRRIMSRMKANGCRRVVMEASSHALSLGRMHGLSIEGAIFTNLSGDHLDFHGTMGRYAASKRSLFAGLSGSSFAVINMDDPIGAVMKVATRAQVLECRLDSSGHAAGRVRILSRSQQGVDVELLHEGRPHVFHVGLPGDHNVMNLLQAMMAANACGQSMAEMLNSIETLPSPRGRLERVPSGMDSPSVFVDFAHTDGALSNALNALRPLVSSGNRLIVVFGCGGDRDQTKRPRMGAVAAASADQVVVTSDNPRTESPQSIIDDILVGLPRGSAVLAEPDRSKAIALAIQNAVSGDVVLIAGKGHEQDQIIGEDRIPFDDRTVALQVLSGQGIQA